jgi:hypothetical protein
VERRRRRSLLRMMMSCPLVVVLLRLERLVGAGSDSSPAQSQGQAGRGGKGGSKQRCRMLLAEQGHSHRVQHGREGVLLVLAARLLI